MRKKLKSRRGVTLLEMLVALILLSLLTTGGVAATTAVMTDYNRMQEAANAEILASTVIEAISNEIRLGKDIEVDPGDSSSLQLGVSAFSDQNVTIKLDDTAHRLVSETKDASGTVISKQMLSEDAYSGLHLEDLTFTEQSVGSGGTADRTVFVISFTVCSDYSGELWTGSVSAAPLVG